MWAPSLATLTRFALPKAVNGHNRGAIVHTDSGYYSSWLNGHCKQIYKSLALVCANECQLDRNLTHLLWINTLPSQLTRTYM